MLINLDMGERGAYAHDKMEGLWLINQQTPGILNDDMGLWTTNGLEQKYLDHMRIRVNTATLYIVDQLNLFNP